MVFLSLETESAEDSGRGFVFDFFAIFFGGFRHMS